MQQALATFTGVQVPDQIAMWGGARLDPSRQLGAYKLPLVGILGGGGGGAPLARVMARASKHSSRSGEGCLLRGERRLRRPW